MRQGELFGVIGLSFVVLLAALFFAQKRYVAWGLLCLLPVVYGVVQIAVVDQKSQQTMRIALVQTGESPLAVLQEHPIQVWHRLVEDLRPVSHPDMVVFPEGALPGDLRNTRIGGMTNEEILRSLSLRYNAPFVAGVEVLENTGVLQAAVFVPPQGETEIYAKRLLVPLAEYIPFEWCRALAARFGIYSSYAQGLKPVLFGGCCAPGICYEETFGHVVRENLTVKPQFLLFICNDGWYPGSLLPWAHFTHARVRAPELGLPLARCCTTGVSALVDPLGRVLAQLGPGEKGVLEEDLPLWSFPTLYGHIGDLGLALFCGFILLGNCVKLLRA
jgi:apolipoprotein N-acyltransferase